MTRTLSGIPGDLRFAARLLRRNPGFTLVALVTLALGIGANTAIFSMVRAVLLRPLPYERPESLHRLHVDWRLSGVHDGSVSVPELDDLRRDARAFERFEAFEYRGLNVTGSAAPQRALAIAITAGLPDLLGIPPALGRTFTPEEDRPDSDAVVLLSHGFWRDQMGADPAALGTTLRLDGIPHTVVGVMPAGFRFPGAGRDIQMYVPLALAAPDEDQRGAHFLNVLGRTRPGIPPAQARADLEQVSRALAQRHAGQYEGTGFTFVPRQLHDALVGEDRAALVVLMTAVGLLLLIACANVANLLLARATGRGREIAIRSALGANRWSLVRQMLVESLLLSGLGGALGLLLARWGLDALLAARPSGAVDREVPIDMVVLLFTAAACAVTGVLFGLAPALHATWGSSAAALKDGARTSTGRATRRLSRSLVVGEIALALMLLVTAGLTLRSFARLVRVDPGFDPRGVWTMGLSLPRADYPEADQVARFVPRLLDRLGRLPGASAAVVSELPLGGSYSSSGFTVQDAMADPSRAELMMDRRAVSPGYFGAMNIPILRGRDFDDHDTAGAPGVVIVDESMARRYWPGGDPIGRRIMMASADSTGVPWLTIVGVVRHARQYGPRIEGREQVYFPFSQLPSRTLSVVLRMDGGSPFQASAVQDEVKALDPSLPIFSVRALQDMVSGSLTGQRFSMGLLIGFALVAVLLCAVGIYGVMACAVNQRRQEIGVRMALGARAVDVERMVLREGLQLAGIGLVIGLAGAAGAGRMMSSLLFGVSPIDPITYLAVSAGLLGVAAAAVSLPARRATRVSPQEALRHD